ncbi:hypothetical protein [Heyndrickxia oleronia]|uniref:hypothetical protein n=1 Tax=Heyndrickxia oleronia TaxID=38875 RepID=UPI0033355B1B
MFFNLFFSIIIIQRLAELFLAKKNERWMKQNGGEEYGVRHYQLMVMIHSCFFLSLLLEVFFFRKNDSFTMDSLVSPFCYHTAR